MKTLSLWVMWVAVVACVWGGFIDEDGYYLMDSLELSAFNCTSERETISTARRQSGLSSQLFWWLQLNGWMVKTAVGSSGAKG